MKIYNLFIQTKRKKTTPTIDIKSYTCLKFNNFVMEPKNRVNR